MQFNLTFVGLMLAGTAAAQFSSSATPSSSSATLFAILNPDDYDSIIADRGCSWTKSEYGYGSDYCGSSPYERPPALNNGDIVVAVAPNASLHGGCYDQTTISCCAALADQECSRGERYLQCKKT